MRRLLIALLALLCASPAFAQPATTTAPGTLLTSPLTIQPASRSQSGWTSNGGRYANPSITLTDTTTAAGTQANGYTDLWSGDTIATQTNAVTFTNYYGSYHTAPVAGTHVTMTNIWALGADSAKINGALSVTGASTLSGAITASGLSSGTQVSCLGLSSANAFVLSSAACGLVASVGAADTTLTLAGSGAGPFTGAVTAKINLSKNNTWTATNTIFQGSMELSGTNPWIDVMAGGNICINGAVACSAMGLTAGAACPAAVGDNVTNDYPAFQCQINYVEAATSTGGGVVWVPCNEYNMAGHTLGLPSGVWLWGGGRTCTIIRQTGNLATIAFQANVTFAGLQHLSVYGYQNSGATTSAVVINDGAQAFLYDVRAWYGQYGLINCGQDGTVFDSYIAGYTGGVYSCGANWYVRVKMDQSFTGPNQQAFIQDNPPSGITINENHFTECDFSGWSGSMDIIDNSGAATMQILNSVLSAAVAITSGKLSIESSELGASISFGIAAGSTAIVVGNFVIGGTVTISNSGTLKCAANSGINNSGC